jgi:hypothetical protein
MTLARILPFDEIMTICPNIGVGYVILLVSHKTFISAECSFITTITYLASDKTLDLD